MSRTSNAKLKEALEAAVKAEREWQGKLWWTRLSEPCRGLYVRDTEEHRDLVTLEAVCYGMGWNAPRHDVAPTTQEGVAYMAFPDLLEYLVAPEGFMRDIRHILRENNCHGTFRRAGEEKTYKF